MPFSTTGILWMEIMHIVFFLHFWNGLTKRWQDDVTDETRYVQIQCNTGTCSQTFPCAIWLWNTLPVDASYRLTVSRPISAVSVSFERETTSCFYHLHCTVFIESYCSSFAAQLSAYSLMARNRVGTVIGRWRWQWDSLGLGTSFRIVIATAVSVPPSHAHSRCLLPTLVCIFFTHAD